jgi:undecaprenyl-diphosphatase
MTRSAPPALVPLARWSRARWLVLALAGLGVLAICSAVAAHGTVDQPEREVFLWVNGLPGWLDPPLWIFQQAGNIVLATLATAAVGLVLRSRRLVLAAPVAAVSKLLLERIVKIFVERERPGTSIGGEAILRGHVPVDGLSFVSGHATITAAMAVLLTATLPTRWRAAPWVFVALNGLGRVHAGAHNPLDIVGGVGLGLAIGAATVALLLRRGDESPRVGIDRRTP